MVQLVRHRQTKESATDRLNLNHRVTPRLHKLEVLGLDLSGNPTLRDLTESRVFFLHAQLSAYGCLCLAALRYALPCGFQAEPKQICQSVSIG
jgi:hypothetical protein